MIAADLHFPSWPSRVRAHEIAGQFGLVFRLPNEAWHVEPFGAPQIARGEMPGGSAFAYAPAEHGVAWQAARIRWPIHGHRHARYWHWHRRHWHHHRHRRQA